VKRLLALLCLVTAPAWAASWPGILAPERAIDWSTAGIPGGIPVRNTVCTTVTAGMSTSAIQSAIDNCPVGQVVSFAAGTYNIGSINVRKAVTLRGQGPTQTYLNVTGNVTLGGEISWNGSTSGFFTNWTGGLTRGSTVLTVASTSGMSAGMTVILDEHNREYVFPQGFQGNCDTSNTCGRQEDGSPSWFGGGGALRAAGTMTKIVSVDSATQITVKDPVTYTRTLSLVPQVFWWTYGAQKGNFEGAGIENMKVYSNENPYSIDIAFCDYCYVRNVSIMQNARSAVRAYWSTHFVIRDSYISSTNTGAPTQYGFEILSSSYGLVENNIAYTVTSALMPQSNHGIVYAYNYTLNRSALLGGDGNQFADAQSHLSHVMFQLFEGNTMATLDVDNVWGSSSHSTAFRNRLIGLQPSKTQYTRALEISAHQRFSNVVANVLGLTGFSSRYRCRLSDGNNNATIYDLGEQHGCWGPETNGSYDAVTYSSLMRWGNWDAVTAAIGGNNGIRYCTGSGAGNSACTEDERGSGDPTFPALSSPKTTFPPSFYYTSVGVHASCGTGLSFWKNPSSGYCPAFPPIGPDVTCTTNCDPNAGGHAFKIPAQLCYENSAKDANGYLTAFDAAACYANDPIVKPNSPTGTGVH
jgi:hypothetical protein